MSNFSIGLSGLNAAYTALDVVGNNIANAATEGYHRQRVELVPASVSQSNIVASGGGVEVAEITRMIDGLLEHEIARQQSSHGEISQQLATMSTVETMFGEFSESGGLNTTIDAFFDALRGLAAHPLENVWRNETISAANVLATEFRRLGDSLSSLGEQVVVEAQNAADAANSLIAQIAELNGKIQMIEINGGNANNLRDHRDQLIVDLGKLAGVETQVRDYGVVDVSIAGLPVVTGSIPVQVSVNLKSDQALGLFAAGRADGSLQVQGGRLGGLLSLKNELLPGVQDELDTLARAIITQINQVHVQGLGTEGAFTELSGWTLNSEALGDSQVPITDGSFYLRLTNTGTGEVGRHRIDVDVSSATPDTLASIAGKIAAISGLSASLDAGRLHIVTDLGYKFDFIPAVLPEPTTSNLTATAPPTILVSGAYTGETNRSLTFTVAGTGTVGNGSLRLDVTDEDGEIVSTLNIGAGYAAGDIIEMSNGIKIAVGTGGVNDSDSFEVQALATTDSSGFLAAAGLNAFFSGASASEMRVCDDVFNTPDRISTALTADLTDNLAALRLSDVRDQAVDSLGGLTPSEYYHRITANLGQTVALKRSRQENIEAVIQNLTQHQSEISGVNINDEAAQLLIFEKMFQAVAKYINSLQTALNTLMDTI
ncbi:MAG: flagellar hook-associated protein FlgK [Sedimentisphaerales bacterium]|nr:flagellar hook-associated protein FlgK [Sedimentisphaerales bacterium]